MNVADQYVRCIAENAAPIAVPIQEIEEASACDVELSLVRNAVQSGKLKELPKDYRNVGNELTVQGWKKYFIFWDRNEKWENFLRVVNTNPV